MTSQATPRRQRLSAETRRDQLVTASIAVLAEHGYAGASADLVATTAGVSKGLIWNYFADRDDLFEQTARLTLVRLRSAVAADIDLSAPAPEVVRSAIRSAAGLLATHQAERRALNEIVLNLRSPDGSLRFGLRDYDETYSGQEAIFRRGQAEGDFRSSLDPRVLAVTYQGAVDAMLGYLDENPDADPAAYSAMVADILLGGMSTTSD